MNKLLPQAPGPIGVFDSGYGGLTILKSIRELLPQYDYVYLGDNARAPYGSRSFDIVYQFTRQAVMKLFEMGCQLVILGCNTRQKHFEAFNKTICPTSTHFVVCSESSVLQLKLQVN